MGKAAKERQVIVTWYDPAEKLPPEDESVVITFSGRNEQIEYEHALGTGLCYQGGGWLIDGMDEFESDRMTIEAWAYLDPYEL